MWYVLLFALFLCVIMRGIIFQARDEKWYKTLIPFYNKYILGKLCDKKIIGITVAVLSALTICAFIGTAIYEFDCIENYAEYATVTNNGKTELYVTLPEIQTNILNISSYVTLGIAFIYFAMWTWMMRDFSVKNGKSSWLLFAWAILPFTVYVYFAITPKVYIPDKGILTNVVVRK